MPKVDAHYEMENLSPAIIKDTLLSNLLDHLNEQRIENGIFSRYWDC